MEETPDLEGDLNLDLQTRRGHVWDPVGGLRAADSLLVSCWKAVGGGGRYTREYWVAVGSTGFNIHVVLWVDLEHTLLIRKSEIYNNIIYVN